MRRAHQAAVMHVHVGQVIAWIFQEAILGARVLCEKIFQLGPSIEKAVAVGQMRVGREPARHPGVGVRNLIERANSAVLRSSLVISWLMMTCGVGCANAGAPRPPVNSN